ncbi:hypothetical protein CKQ90_28290, partial [Klebsiella pneumoniae]
NGSSFPYFDSLQFADSVESVRKLDNQTVEFRLKRPDASFLWHLATHYASITSAEYAARLTQDDRQEQLDRQPVGTGPFNGSSFPYFDSLQFADSVESVRKLDNQTVEFRL